MSISFQYNIHKLVPITGPGIAAISRSNRRYHLSSILAEAAMSQENGTTTKNQKKLRGDFGRWQRYLQHVGINDPWLEALNTTDRNKIMCGFAECLRSNRFGRTKRTYLRAKTVSSIVGSVCSTFRSNFRDDPSLDSAGRPTPALKRQIASYEVTDPSERHQKALPIRISKALWEAQSNPLGAAIGQLTTGAFFFAMRSCEYCRVPVPGKTKLLRIGDL